MKQPMANSMEFGQKVFKEKIDRNIHILLIFMNHL